MKHFDIITLFPEIFDFYFSQGLLAKSQKKRLIKIRAHQLRNFSSDKHKTVDDKPFGGGRGMVLKVEPLLRAVKKLSSFSSGRSETPSRGKTKIILLSPRGKKFNQKMAAQYSKLDQLIIISGRYEGIDERAAKYIADEMVSIGDYVLMSGDIGAIAVIEAAARLLPGVVGHSEDMLQERITKNKGFVEYPQYTRPEIIEINGHKRRVPKALLSGHHKKIAAWRAKHSKVVE